jgi:uncharacterized protein (DUF885 family)
MNTRLYLLIMCLVFGIVSPARADDAQRFDELTQSFLDGYLAWRPALAVHLGLHEYDGKVADRSDASIAHERSRLKEFETAIRGCDPTKLDPTRRFDRQILLTAIGAEIFRIDDERHYRLNPMAYVLGEDVNVYIERNFAPLQERLRSVINVERSAPQLVDAARRNLDESLPRPFVETAIRNAKGSATFLEHELPAAFAPVKDAALLAQFGEINGAAVSAMRDYARWLETEKLPKANASFALGRQRYVKMLQTQELITLSPEQILEMGLAQIKRQQAVFNNAARVIDPSRKPLDVYVEIQKDHPTADRLIPDTRRDLETIRQFVIDRHLVKIPSQVRAKVMETPGFYRAASFASMSSPGAFETEAKDAIYYVTPVESDWSDKRKEEWLTSFNYYTLDVVSIHEAYPGHYVQFLHLNASPATRIEKIFGSYAFVEGWAHYCEQMVLDEGFGGEGVQAAKFRMTQSSDALLRLCRLCCSIKMHCQGMSVDQAAQFFHENCYYEPEPSRQEAIRGTFDPGYLYYSIGKMQILKLREDYRRQEGAHFSLQNFHDAVLGHGMPPVRLLRELLLKDPRVVGQDM